MAHLVITAATWQRLAAIGKQAQLRATTVPTMAVTSAAGRVFG
jgi:hypothetical protein